ncbi:MAG: hypothetical protein QNK03_26840 [Myxococcota bacterium]|nr:hypothetical protein [Myxococcota bacterium]
MSADVTANRVSDPLRLVHERSDEVLETTLLELVRAISEVTDDDREVLATVMHLLRSGRVRLVGNFRGELPDAA